MTDRVSVTADLHLSVDGHTAHLAADGSRMHLVTSHPAALFARLPRLAPTALGQRAAVRDAALLLDRAELALDISDGRRVLVTVGHGQRSRVGRVLTGSSLVTPGRPAAVVAAAWAALRVTWRDRRRSTRSGPR